MIQIGKWTGFYSFSEDKINKMRGFEKTSFDLQILSLRENTFIGKVQDDLASGGAEGIGEVVGQLQGDRIDFVKKLPVMTLIVDRKGTTKTFNQKHPPIYYTGRLSNDGHSAEGTWRFKFGIVWLGIIPLPIMPCKGIWSMTFMK